MSDLDNIRNGEDGSDRLLAACYTELKNTRAKLTSTQKENADLKIKLDNALQISKNATPGERAARKLTGLLRKAFG